MVYRNALSRGSRLAAPVAERRPPVAVGFQPTEWDAIGEFRRGATADRAGRRQRYYGTTGSRPLRCALNPTHISFQTRSHFAPISQDTPLQTSASDDVRADCQCTP